MSTRAKASGAEGTVIDGRFRDLDEQRGLEYPVCVGCHSLTQERRLGHFLQTD